MARLFFILLASLLFGSLAWSQPKPKPKSKPASQNAVGPVEVLFATNADVDLFINGEAQGAVLKSDFHYLKLQPGAYTYKARSKSTGDEFSDSFSVAARGSNEVFIDALYFIDVAQASRNGGTITTGTDGWKFGGAPDATWNGFSTTGHREVAAVNSLLSTMLPVNGGSFTMGNNRAGKADERERKVTVGNVLIGRYEVTQRQWELVMGNNPSLHSACATCPVENVSWEEVDKYIVKLNAASGRKFRLPTEAEWEYVSKLGGKVEVDTSGGQEAFIKKTAWYFSNSSAQTHPVGTKRPTAIGLFDLTGNVSEWCLDWYDTWTMKEGIALINPTGPGKGIEKVIRGGNYRDYQGDRFRPSYRLKEVPAYKSGELGFRLVLESD